MPREESEGKETGQVVQQELTQALDFSKMKSMQVVDFENLKRWVQADVDGDAKTKKEILDRLVKNLISNIPDSAKTNIADIRKKLVTQLQERTIQAGGTSKMVNSSFAVSTVKPRVKLPPRAGVEYTKRPLVSSPSVLSPAEELVVAVTPSVLADKGETNLLQKRVKPPLAKQMSSRSDYGELENDSKEFENAALFNHGGLGLVVTVEENQGGNVLSAEPAIPTLNRSLSRQCVLTPVELSNERVLNDTHLPPPPSFGRYTIRTLQRNISKIVGEEHEPGGDEAAITPDIIPGNLKKADSAVSDTDYGDIVDEESGEHQDVILEVPSSSAADERSHSLRFSFKQDQRQPSQRNLAQQSSSKILAQAASDLVASEEAKIGENDFSEPSASAALEGTMKELPLVKPAILAPPAELYRQLSQKEQSELDNGKMIAVETKGESYKSYGITYYKPSTFTAYYLLDADERSVADLYWDPSEATAIFPNCVHVSRMKNTSASAFVNYTFQVEANVPFIGRQVFQETVSMKNDRFVVEGQEEKISFENTNEGTYLKTFKGSFSIVPHQDKLLAAYEVTTEFKGVAGQLITNDAIRNIVYTVLLNLINRARVSK